MRKVSILTTIAITFGFLWSGVAAFAGDKIQIQAVPPQQQQEGNGMSQWPTYLDCGPTQIILNEFKGTRGEIEMLQGNGVIMIPGSEKGQQGTRPIQLPMVQYFNPKTGTWSIVAHMETGMSCVVVFGNMLQPVQGGLDNRKPKTPTELDKETLDQKMDRTTPVDPRDIKTIKDSNDGAIALAT